MWHAFEEHHAGRVALKTDLRNERSQRAIARLGATREGASRNHRLLRTGQYRHTVYYSVISSEWPGVREHMRALLRQQLSAPRTLTAALRNMAASPGERATEVERLSSRWACPWQRRSAETAPE